jgi:Zn-dependent M28 family amino/carboxypeptidase
VKTDFLPWPRVALGLFLVVVVMESSPPRACGSYQPAAEEQQAAGAIQENVLRAHVRFLADDLLEGRGPGTRGDLLAQLYIETEFQALGLRPAFGPGQWRQPVPLIGIVSHVPETLDVRVSGKQLRLQPGRDFMAVAGRPVAEVVLENAPLVFVGYGIVAPEFQWDDYHGTDVRGKVVVLLNNDPEDDPQLFAGKTRLYYGRWDYKFAEAARHGAVGAFIIHTTPSAGYPWQVVQTSWGGEQFQLRDGEEPHPLVEGWLTEKAAQELMAHAGLNLHELTRQATQRGFRAIALNATASLCLTATTRHVDTANVVAMLPAQQGSPEGEYLLYTAHFDHLGMSDQPDAEGDRIYNGAVDNATGVAGMLAIARAFTQLPQKPGRGVLFAAVGAEEQGLLGSKYLAEHPPVPLDRLVACLNLDALNIWGRTRDVIVIGYGRTTLDQWLHRVAAWQGRVVKPDQFPDRGFYYRSDHFSFARQGVPALFLRGGVEFLGRSAEWGREVIERWERTHYHQRSDKYAEDWELEGAVEDLRLLFYVGLQVAKDPARPRWKPGAEFERLQGKLLGEAGSP